MEKSERHSEPKGRETVRLSYSLWIGAKKEEVIVMVTENGNVSLDITEGPGELDFITVLLRGGEFTITIAGKGRRVRIPKKESWEIKGQIEVSSGQWVDFDSATYAPKSRLGRITLLATEECQFCNQPIPKGTRFCPNCGKDQKDVG